MRHREELAVLERQLPIDLAVESPLMELTPFGLLVLMWSLPTAMLAFMAFCYWRGYTWSQAELPPRENWRHEDPFEFWSDMVMMGAMALFMLGVAVWATRDYLAGQL